MKQSQVVELTNKFEDDLDKDHMYCKSKFEFEKNTPSSKDTHLDDIMSYNDFCIMLKEKTTTKIVNSGHSGKY